MTNKCYSCGENCSYCSDEDGACLSCISNNEDGYFELSTADSMDCEYFEYGTLCGYYAYLDSATDQCEYCGDYCNRCMHGDGQCT